MTSSYGLSSGIRNDADIPFLCVQIPRLFEPFADRVVDGLGWDLLSSLKSSSMAEGCGLSYLNALSGKRIRSGGWLSLQLQILQLFHFEALNRTKDT